jgi:hypothetical protein
VKRSVIILAFAVVALAAPRAVRAQQAKEFLVPPSGGAYEILVHPAFVTALSFPEKLSPRALASDVRDNYDVKPNGDDGISIRPLKPDAKAANITVATVSGGLKVSLTFRIVADTKDAYTLVSFKQTSEDEAFQQRVADEVAKETEALRNELAKAKAALDAKVRDQADTVVATRILQRFETHDLTAIERNDDNVIVRVQRAVFLGEDAYLLFEIQNRGGSAYRLAKVRVLAPNGKDHAGAARMATTALAEDRDVIGVVAAGGRGQGVVVLRQVDELLGKPLELTIEQPGSRGQVTVKRGVMLR